MLRCKNFNVLIDMPPWYSVMSSIVLIVHRSLSFGIFFIKNPFFHVAKYDRTNKLSFVDQPELSGVC